MREYELTYLVSDDVLEADLKKVSDKVAAFITDAEGKISKDESWGRRKLTYPINKQNFATYITLWFELDGQKLAEIDHEVKVM
ncbi:30S ribosomal protein S6, partial [Candidatus Berkelbacteria bacterium CG08_land_8_20_14_0_20_39_8]